MLLDCLFHLGLFHKSPPVEDLRLYATELTSCLRALVRHTRHLLAPMHEQDNRKLQLYVVKTDRQSPLNPIQVLETKSAGQKNAK